jgi:outer membrane protein OmpA-like peptidoglycan-associated protein
MRKPRICGMAAAVAVVLASTSPFSAPSANAQSLDFLNALLGINNDGVEVSPLQPITQPLGEALAPLLSNLNQGLDPLTDVLDDQLLELVLDGLGPLTEPLLGALEPLTNPVDGIVSDLTGGSLEDALTNIDDNTADGNGVVNDLLGGAESTTTGTEAGEFSPINLISGPLGESLAPLIDFLDDTLAPLTDAIDDTIGVTLLEGLAPLTEPLLGTLEPVTDPVDGLVKDLTGGSLEDALTNSDDNIQDGDGIVNDLLGGDRLADSGTEAGELSPLPGITEPLGESLAPLVDTLDNTLGILTDAVDDNIGEPLLGALSQVTEPVLSALEPVTDPVDGIIADVTGGSLEDALTNFDDNTADGDGIVNDLLGGEVSSTSGTEAGEVSPLANITDPLGKVLDPVISAVDELLNPITDVIDDQLGEPLLGALAPVVIPVTDLIEPVTDPVDGLIADVTGGSLEDSLTNFDDNTADGDGLVNDLLGGGGNGGSDAFDGGELQPALIALADPAFDNGDCSDQDGDGVCDAQDSCPDTPQGAVVLNNGCHFDGVEPLRLEGVYFEYDSDELTPDSIAVLESAVLVINSSTAKRLEIAGHTDARGTDEYNERLSDKRAQSVVNYLTSHGVESSRLEAHGYGESKPVADNDSEEGMALNRRVEVQLLEE